MSATASSGWLDVLQTLAFCHEKIWSLVETVQNFHEAQWKQSNHRDVSITHIPHCSPHWVLSRQITKRVGYVTHLGCKGTSPANTCCMITGGFITVQMWSYVSRSSMHNDNSATDILTVHKCSVSQFTKLSKFFFQHCFQKSYKCSVTFWPSSCIIGCSGQDLALAVLKLKQVKSRVPVKVQYILTREKQAKKYLLAHHVQKEGITSGTWKLFSL